MPSSVPQPASPLFCEGTRSIDNAFLAMSALRKGNYPFRPLMVAGRYELLREIGSGGYGTVYEAKDQGLGRRVAVKVLDLGDGDVATREGRVLAELHHPNIVAIHDHGVGPDYRYFILHFLAGPTLREWCRGKTPEEIIAKFVEAAQGLAAAHVKGLAHRDFKPSNVRISAEGRAVVVDFGLARHLDTLEGEPQEREKFEGTMDYAAPERLIGKPGHEWSDQFSFCVALWEALSGVNPFGRCTRATTTADRLRAIVRGPVGTPRGPRRVTRALRRGLCVGTTKRMPSMEALIDVLVPMRRARRVLIGTGLALGIAGLQLCQPPPGVASSEFVASVHASCLGPIAVTAVRQGDVDGALGSLDSAEKTKNRSQQSSRGLAIASEAVALEFERRIPPTNSSPDRYADALDAWYFALIFAAHAGDAKLQDEIKAELHALRVRVVPH